MSTTRLVMVLGLAILCEFCTISALKLRPSHIEKLEDDSNHRDHQDAVLLSVSVGESKGLQRLSFLNAVLSVMAFGGLLYLLYF